MALLPGQVTLAQTMGPFLDDAPVPTPTLNAAPVPTPKPTRTQPQLTKTENVFPITIRLLKAGTRAPISNAVVVLTQTGETRVSDQTGTLRFEAVPPGTIDLQIKKPAMADIWAQFVVGTHGEAADTLYLRLEKIDDGTIIISETRDDAPISERKIDVKEIRLIPGSLGDPVRAVQNMPGVAWAPLSLGLIIVRGSNPEDSGYYLDGVRIPQVFHFLGVTTIVNADSLEAVHFYPGGFGVRYGRVLGGVIDLESKASFSNSHHGYVAVDLFHSSAYATGPIGEHSGYTLSFRRSYIDQVLKPVLSRLDLGAVIQAPRYWDYQIGLYHRLGDRHRFRVLLVGSQDRFAVFGEPPEDAEEDSVEEAILDYTSGLKQLQFRWNAILGERLASETILALGPQPNEASYGTGAVAFSPFNIQLRQEFRGVLGPKNTARGGLDLEITKQYIRFEAGTGVDADITEEAIWTVAPAPYVEFNLHPINELFLMPGLRLDPFVLVGQPNFFSVDPRIAARYIPRKDLRFKGAIGRFSGFPSSLEYLESFGTPELGAEHGIQSSLGVEKDLPASITVDFLGYLNRYSDLVVFNTQDVPSAFDIASGEVDAEEAFDGPIYVNQGEGLAFGIETMIRRNFGQRFWGWTSYTLQRSLRKENAENDWSLYDFDQTHLLTLVGILKLPKAWSLGGRFRFGSGGVFTPVIGRSYSVDSGAYSPFYGEKNSDRYPDRHSLDIRVERTFTYDLWSLGVYLDLQNAYNHKNVESHYFSWDYDRLYYVSGLPIFPAFGIQGRW